MEGNTIFIHGIEHFIFYENGQEPRASFSIVTKLGKNVYNVNI